jgi:hypothetical protein
MIISSGRTSWRETRGRCAARRWLCAVALVATFDTLAIGVGSGQVLYDAVSGVRPDESPWQWLYAPSAAGSVTGMGVGASFLDTTASSGKAGYGLLARTALDSSVGFHLDFSFRVASETHANNDRSGFSVIVLDTAARGVELSFWTDQVWAKNAGATPFTHGESVALDTHGMERSYRLSFLGGSYALAADGAPALSGVLRDYAAVAPFPANLVYGQASFVFFGDNTDSAAARVELSRIALVPVPEPAEWALLLAGLGCVALATRQRRACAPVRHRPE